MARHLALFGITYTDISDFQISMTSIPRVAIIIVNYRTPDLVRACLDSLAQEAGPDLELQAFVGDAASGDGSVVTISDHIAQQGFGDWASCLDIGCNRGFAYGNNWLFRTCVAPEPGFDYVHFLNPDTYIHRGAVRALVDFLAARPMAGVAGSRLENPDGSWRAYGFRFPTPWREFFRGARLSALERLVPSASIKIADLADTRAVDWVTGASFMAPRRVLDRVGLMDDNYFLYFEETDLMARVRAAGYGVWHVAESRVVHLAGQSTGLRSDDVDIKRLSPIWLQSRWRFMRKLYGRHGAIMANALFLAGNLLYRIKCLLLLRTIQDPPHLWRDYLVQPAASSS
ncbi:glycosyltransferase family 2 protein [Tateyamaria sp.]|uniref:glycosyltransferase family 2 protein n=1 Tax=Tateyamaria sp. TaxID=1929288 RepID=UPI00329B514D